MVGIAALWMPIIVSAVFIFIALTLIHALLGWHKSDMAMVPDEAKVMETLRTLNAPPGDYRFPFSNDVNEMKSPAFEEKMRQGAVGSMTILPNGDMNMGRMFGLWFVYTILVAVLVAYVTGSTRPAGTPFAEIFRLSGTVAFCCYVVAHWQNWIWWGKGTRFTVTYSLDGVIFALVTAATFGWLWPR
ncbi:MAG: hypothetical protein JWO05_2813 [Gemmatimonadetes bacterium]|nr:hypothetical protein [Gemmatimonadota bacterium]